MRFRLVHLMYATALLASSLATFGSPGLVAGLLLLAVWTYVFLSASRPRALATIFLLAVAGFCLTGLLLPAMSRAREAARRMQCAGHLKQIALALHNYHDIHKSFPPAYLAAEDGKPMHSWRVLILPYLEHQALYKAYSFQEPWNGPNNRKLAALMPRVFSCPSLRNSGRQGDTHTSYLAVVDPDAAWPGATARSLKEFTDGTSRTILVVEADPQGVHWMEPRDLRLADSIQMMNAPDMGGQIGHQTETFFFEEYLGRNVVFADGRVRFFYHGLPQDTWAALLQIEDGLPQNDDHIDRPIHVMRRLKLGNCFRLGLFVCLALLPLPWVWIRPGGLRPRQHLHERHV